MTEVSSDETGWRFETSDGDSMFVKDNNAGGLVIYVSRNHKTSVMTIPTNAARELYGWIGKHTGIEHRAVMAVDEAIGNMEQAGKELRSELIKLGVIPRP